MRRLKRVLILLIILLISFSGCQNKEKDVVTDSKILGELTQEEKIQDFNYMYDILKESYPYFEVNKRLNGVDWLGNKELFLNKVKATNSDEEFYESLQQALGYLYNWHTSIVPKKFYDYMKEFYEMDKKLNSAWVEELNKLQSKMRYGESEGNVDSNSSIQNQGNYAIPNNVRTDIIKNHEVAYLHIGSFNSFNIEGDMELIRPFLKEIKNYKALIIDIRRNSGGHSGYWSDNLVPMLINKPFKNVEYIAYRGSSFIEPYILSRQGRGYKELNPIEDIDKENLKNLPPEVKKDFKYYYKSESIIEPKDSIGFKGKVFLLVDGYVYSSSEMFATFCKSTGFATLIGEKTGGDGIGSDPALCALPNSGYILRFPKEMGLTADGTCNEESKTEPDIKVNAVMQKDYLKDKAIMTVLDMYK